ncbi:MAG: ATP-binding cassette domain-containing protein [Candidatus Omnitrophica bacterium]|nr:ATP-binding cassette domain-containing protein [Candidatus Omnitrophota bacterium]MCF7876780.1 ATP-binding cassette domain-containing protein [Candidatus Omnitrophota bacterium]MCF7878226.1 ATP-binding cassette domain-containing protein [Candidatus Omnitrophota bacterium]
MLKIKNLTFTYPQGATALSDINMELPREHILAILGRSGSGKTTLLKCIGRFLKAKKGDIALDDESIYKMERKRLRHLIGIVFQQLYLFPHLTILENMCLAPVKVLEKNKSSVKKEAKEMLNKLGIKSLADRYPSQISGGQAQRAAIARALIMKPQYLLLDEPTSALDLNTSKELGEWLLELKAETTFVVVTHDVLFTKNIANSGFLLSRGKLKTKGRMEHIVETLGLGGYQR